MARRNRSVFKSTEVTLGYNEGRRPPGGCFHVDGSHVINKDALSVSLSLDKVESAIKALNYAPSALARSLKLNQTRTIGMLITASTNPFYSELVRGVERSCFERGYSLVLCNTEGDEQRMNRKSGNADDKTRGWLAAALHGNTSAFQRDMPALSFYTDRD